MDSDHRRRYARHLLIPEIGEEGQQKLSDASVLVIGAGGLGAAAMSYLAAAGIGRLGIVDHDHVELSNLNRQIIHESGDIGRKKVESAADRISEINPCCRVETYAEKLDEKNVARILNSWNLVLDGSDNFPTRFAVNSACHAGRVPLISGAVRGLKGQITTFKSYLGAGHPCYRCLVPELPPNRNDCAEGGILGPIVGVVGSLMAVEAIKEVIGTGQTLGGRLLRYDALKQSWKESRLAKDPECPVCAVN
ncbi:MAG: molybdopterin-synthase adenylyltransferase MoeB [Rickettsiales bacterium]